MTSPPTRNPAKETLGGLLRNALRWFKVPSVPEGALRNVGDCRSWYADRSFLPSRMPVLNWLGRKISLLLFSREGGAISTLSALDALIGSREMRRSCDSDVGRLIMAPRPLVEDRAELGSENRKSVPML